MYQHQLTEQTEVDKENKERQNDVHVVNVMPPLLLLMLQLCTVLL